MWGDNPGAISSLASLQVATCAASGDSFCLVAPLPVSGGGRGVRDLTLALDSPALTLTDVREAARRIAPHIRHTPLQSSPDLSALAGRTLLLKLENLQRTG